MKDFNIDGTKQRVFVLTENASRVVYIPLKDLHRVDYTRLVDLEARDGELLKVMASTTLDNGMNALTQYESLLQIADITGDTAHRVKKPNEKTHASSQQIAQDPNAVMLAILERLANIASAPAPVAPAPVAPRVSKPRAAPKK